MSDVALITGGANGIGRAVALKLAANGIYVIIADQEEGAAKEVRDRIVASGGQAEAVRVDVTKAGEVEAAVGGAFRRHGRIDVLANIAGGSFYRKPVEETSWQEWKEVLDANLKGAFLFCREVAPIMQRQRRGRIVNTSSNYGVAGSALRAAYSAAKAGIIGFVKALARELGPDHITVNAICPGIVDTALPREHQNEAALQERLKENPLGHGLTTEDLVGPVLFLASDAAAYITGQVLNVNCGSSMH